MSSHGSPCTPRAQGTNDFLNPPPVFHLCDIKKMRNNVSCRICWKQHTACLMNAVVGTYDSTCKAPPPPPFKSGDTSSPHMGPCAPLECKEPTTLRAKHLLLQIW